MNEMTSRNNKFLGGSVKKTLLVVAVAAILVFAFAGSALAVNHSGQQRLGTAAVTGAPVGGAGVNPTNNVAGAGTATYMDWSTGIGNVTSETNGIDGSVGNALDNSPHGSYTTNTVKCAVCHAVHYAAAGNAPVAGGTQTADTLLRMKASQSCVYCHATGGQAVNGRPVYNGIGTITTSGGGSTVGHAIGNNCDECHTGPHGANADESIASLSGYLLKNQSNAVTSTAGVASTTTNMIGAANFIDAQAVAQGFTTGAALGYTPATLASTNSSTIREQAVGIFCAECHNGAYATQAPGAATNVSGMANAQAGPGVGLGGALSGHRIGAAATSTWQSASGQVSSSAMTGVAVAWAAANNCKSCHDSVDTYGNSAFPHAWGQDSAGSQTRMWLLQAADQGSTKTALPQLNSSPSAYSVGKSQQQLYDGVCLKCHVNSGATAGVGVTF
jgi:hypothetical protein